MMGCSEHECGVHLSPGKSSWSRGSASDTHGLAGRAGSVHAAGCGSQRSEALSPPTLARVGPPESVGAGGTEARPRPSTPSPSSLPGGRVLPVSPEPRQGRSSHLRAQPGQWLGLEEP